MNTTNRDTKMINVPHMRRRIVLAVKQAASIPCMDIHLARLNESINEWEMGALTDKQMHRVVNSFERTLDQNTTAYTIEATVKEKTMETRMTTTSTTKRDQSIADVVATAIRLAFDPHSDNPTDIWLHSHIFHRVGSVEDGEVILQNLVAATLWYLANQMGGAPGHEPEMNNIKLKRDLPPKDLMIKEAMMIIDDVYTARD